MPCYTSFRLYTSVNRHLILLIFSGLEYAQIGVKFPPSTVLRTLYVHCKEKNSKFSKTFLYSCFFYT
jgi:hypothetical protein